MKKAAAKSTKPQLRTVADVNRDQAREMEQALGPINDKPAAKHTLAGRIKSQRAATTDTAPHLIVEARAGTGKTTTLVGGVKVVKGLDPGITPSVQQAAVWECMALSKGYAQSIAMVAFNKSIATELQQRMPQGTEAMTMHSMGYSAVRKAFGSVKVNSYRVQDVIAELLEKDIRQLRRDRPVLVKATEDLVGLCKMNLVGHGWTGEYKHQSWEDELSKLAAYYDIDLNGDWADVFALVPRVLERCKDVARDGCIDFNDMIWLPVALDLPVYKYDLLLVDEAQDLNRCQQQLALKAGRRLVLCGDPKQAIYGFAGADAESMPRMAATLGDTERGCVTLPLTVTRRCGRAIVAEAQKIVLDFEAHESNGEGTVRRAAFKGEVARDNDGELPQAMDGLPYRSQVQDGDFLLCRVNAPLVSQAFRFIKEGRRANIAGRDIGQGLISTVKKLHADTVKDLVAKLSCWYEAEQDKEHAKKNPSEQRLIAMQDRYDCLLVFTEDANTVQDVVSKIERIFTDDKSGIGIRLSSIHRAKGLESRRVFLLEPEGATVPHPMAKSKWQHEQEMNLRYVAITRAISELVYVS